MRNADRAIEIAVTDTGIGIPEDKQELIFEAFQQADGTTSRKYGGTGLGLSISREIARLLGGELQVRSKAGEGSTFSLLFRSRRLATDGIPSGATSARFENSGAMVPSSIAARAGDLSTTATTSAAEPFVLIVEDDPTFATILLDFAREAGLKGVISTAGAGTLAMARKLQPNAITLDLGLADIDGFVLLDLLKHDAETGAHPDSRDLGRRPQPAVLEHGRSRDDRKAGRAQELAKLFRDLAAEVEKQPKRRAGQGRASVHRGKVPELAGTKMLDRR